MLPISSKDIINFTPTSLEKCDPKPVFKLAPLTIAQRAKFRRDLAKTGAVYIDADRYIEAMAQATKSLSVAEAEEAQEIIAFLKTDSAARAKTYSKEDLELWNKKAADLEAFLYEKDADLRNIMAERQYHSDMSFIMAVRHGLRGWDNFTVAFEKDQDGLISEQSFNALPQTAILEIGIEVLNLMQPRGQVAKN